MSGGSALLLLQCTPEILRELEPATLRGFLDKAGEVAHATGLRSVTRVLVAGARDATHFHGVAGVLFLARDAQDWPTHTPQLPWEVACAGDAPARIAATLRSLVRRIQDRLERSRSADYWQRMVVEAPDAWMTFSSRGTIAFANAAAETLLGMERASLLGKDPIREDWLVADDRDAAQEAFRMCLEGVRRGPLEIALRRLDGTTQHLEITARPGLTEDSEDTEVRVSMRDITRRKTVEFALRESEERFRALADATSEGILFHADGTILDVNERFSEITGFSPDDLVGRQVHEMMSPSALRRAVKMMGREQARYELEIMHKRGYPIRLAVTSRPLPYRGTMARVVYVRDVTISFRQEEEKRLAQLVLQNTPSFVFRWGMSPGSPILYVSDNIRHFGYDPTDMVARRIPFESLVYPGDLEVQREKRERLRALGQTTYQFSYRLLTASGQVRWVEDFTFESAGQDGEEGERRGLLIDITEQKEAELRIEQAVHYDQLTGFPNRPSFRRRADALLNLHPDGQWWLAVVDLDRFQQVNESFGHDVGDTIVREFTQRLQQIFDEPVLFGRHGSDEIMVLLDAPENARGEPKRLLDGVSQAVDPAFTVQGQDLYITASIGIVRLRGAQPNLDAAMRHTHAALAEAKRSGRGRFAVYRDDLEHRSWTRLRLQADLRRAIANDELLLHYQPQYSLSSGVLVGAEALVRWQHPERGLLLPGIFIAEAEEAGLIESLGKWVLRQACREVRGWIEAGHADVRVAVNLSAQQFEDVQLADTILETCAEEGVPPHAIELEITESTIMRNARQALHMLSSLRDHGLRIVVDDFGTGHSSLSYLRRFPVHGIKVDRSFVRGALKNPRDARLLTAIIHLGKGLDLEVCVEGVEDLDQLRSLRSTPADHVQGNLIGPAAPADQFRTLHLGVGPRPELTD